MFRVAQVTRRVTCTQYIRCICDKEPRTPTTPRAPITPQNDPPKPFDPPTCSDQSETNQVNTKEEFEQVLSKWSKAMGLETPIGLALRRTLSMTFETLTNMIDLIFDKAELYTCKVQPVVKKSLHVAKLNLQNVSEVLQEKNPKLACGVLGVKESVRNVITTVRTRAVQLDEKYQIQYGFKSNCVKGSLSFLEGIKTFCRKLQNKFAPISKPTDDSIKTAIRYDLKILSTGAMARTITTAEHLEQILSKKVSTLKPREIKKSLDPTERKLNDYEKTLLQEERIYEEKFKKLQEKARYLMPPKPKTPGLKDQLISVFTKTFESLKSLWTLKNPLAQNQKDSLQATGENEKKCDSEKTETMKAVNQKGKETFQASGEKKLHSMMNLESDISKEVVPENPTINTKKIQIPGIRSEPNIRDQPRFSAQTMANAGDDNKEDLGRFGLGTQYIQVSKRFEFDDMTIFWELKPPKVEVQLAKEPVHQQKEENSLNNSPLAESSGDILMAKSGVLVKSDPIKKIAIKVSKHIKKPEIQTKPLRIRVVHEQSAEKAIAEKLKSRRKELQQRAETRRARARKQNLNQLTDNIFKNIDFPELMVKRIDPDALEEQSKPVFEPLYKVLVSQTRKGPDDSMTDEQKRALEALEEIEKRFGNFSEKIDLIREHGKHFHEGVKRLKTKIKKETTDTSKEDGDNSGKTKDPKDGAGK